MKRIFISGIGTEVGKTIVSAIFVECLKADYWKPVQAGNLAHSDTETVKKLIAHPQTPSDADRNGVNVQFHPEIYRLTQPVSPHLAAKYDNVRISIKKFVLPKTDNHLIIEGAGGVFTPLNQKLLMIDLIKHLKTEVVLVSRNYLGSINHTLLSVEALKRRDIPIIGIVFNDYPCPFSSQWSQNKEWIEESENFILNYTKLPCLLRIKEEKKINKEVVSKYAKKLKLIVNSHFLA